MDNLHNHKIFSQFEILRTIVLSSSEGDKPTTISEAALKEAGKLVGLTAGSLILWDDSGKPVLTVGFSAIDSEKEALKELEDDVFEKLRLNKKLVSAYLKFGGDKPLSGFTHPIRKGEHIFGAVSGIQSGTGSLAQDDLFLEALAAALSVSFAAGGMIKEGIEVDKTVRKERLKAIRETAATVNHEINNPLTAVLGNVQLLLMKEDELSGDFIRKLKVVEESALRIRDVTQKLMNLTNDSVTEYIPGSQMIDLYDPDKEE